MDSRRCEYCGSNNLVWDQSRGIVVCGECGTVLENIYDFRPPFIEPVVSKRVTRVGRIIKDPTFLREFYVFLNKTKFIRRTKKLKLEISQISDKNSHKIKIYSTEALEALSYLKNDRKASKVYDYLEREGIFSGLKLKTRVIVTYYLVYNGDRKAIRLATKNMRVNENNIKRIVKKIPFPVKIKARKIIEE